MIDDQRIAEALENASATIKNLRKQLDVAIKTLEYYADSDSDDLERFSAIEALDQISAISDSSILK